MTRIHLPTVFLILTTSVPVIGCGGGSTSSDTDDTSSSSTASTASSSSASSETGVVSANDFIVLFSSAIVTVFDDDGRYTQETVEVGASAESRNDIASLTGTTVTFRTEWGSFVVTDGSTATCELDNTGSCSITWRAGDPSTAPSNCRVGFTAYVTGEEEFNDINDNGVYDDADDNGTLGAGFIDVSEPFLPTFAGEHDAVFSATLDQLIDVSPTNTVYDSGDGFYNGANCSHTQGLCGPTTTIIWDWSTLQIKGDPDEGDPLVCPA
ncbi:MAG: hypothetical protein AAF434_00880 [Pseudomonadota bacterium]